MFILSASSDLFVRPAHFLEIAPRTGVFTRRRNKEPTPDRLLNRTKHSAGTVSGNLVERDDSLAEASSSRAEEEPALQDRLL
jgi:hypothetical protein